MSKNTEYLALSKTCRPLMKLMENLTGEDGGWWHYNLKCFLRREKPAKPYWRGKSWLTHEDFDKLFSELSKALIGKRGKIWIKSLTLLLDGNDPWNINLWDKWGTISYGNISTPRSLRQYCRLNDGIFGSEIEFFFKELEMPKQPGKVNYMIVPVRLLGFKHSATIVEINKAVIELGFKLFTEEQIFSLFYGNTDWWPYIIPCMEPKIFPDNQRFNLFLKENKRKEIFALNERYPIDADSEVAFIK